MSSLSQCYNLLNRLRYLIFASNYYICTESVCDVLDVPTTLTLDPALPFIHDYRIARLLADGFHL